MTYAIWVREHDGEREVELCRVKTNPHMIVKEVRAKRLRVDLGGRKKKLTSVPRYVSVRVEEV